MMMMMMMPPPLQPLQLLQLTTIIAVAFLALSIGQADGASLCYQCHAKSNTSGKYCSLESLCSTAEHCYFQLVLSGQWEAGCDTSGASFTGCRWESSSVRCFCRGILCNRLEKMLDSAHSVIPTGLSIAPDLPSNRSVECLECGQVNVTGFGQITLPCNGKHHCRGSYCVMVSGSMSYSYCGSQWGGDNETDSCGPGLEAGSDHCTCRKNFCNQPYPTALLPRKQSILARMAAVRPSEDKNTTVRKHFPGSGLRVIGANHIVVSDKPPCRSKASAKTETATSPSFLERAWQTATSFFGSLRGDQPIPEC